MRSPIWRSTNFSCKYVPPLLKWQLQDELFLKDNLNIIFFSLISNELRVERIISRSQNWTVNYIFSFMGCIRWSCAGEGLGIFRRTFAILYCKVSEESIKQIGNLYMEEASHSRLQSLLWLECSLWEIYENFFILGICQTLGFNALRFWVTEAGWLLTQHVDLPGGGWRR